MPVIADINEGLPRRSAAVREDGTMEEERHATTTIERRTLRRLLPTPFAVLRHLLSTHELQEPTFKEVVILYRMAKPKDDCKPGPGGAGPLEAAGRVSKNR